MTDANLRDIVKDVSRSMRRVAEGKRVSNGTDGVTGNIPFRGDYGRLRQMLMIVVDNAVKFPPPGDTVKISRAEQGNRCVLSVIDRSSGIPAVDLPHIFDRFHRERGEQNKQGSGLGLAIAGEIAKRHGIEMTVDSHPGRTEFRFIFPH